MNRTILAASLLLSGAGAAFAETPVLQSLRELAGADVVAGLAETPAPKEAAVLPYKEEAAKVFAAIDGPKWFEKRFRRGRRPTWRTLVGRWGEVARAENGGWTSRVTGEMTSDDEWGVKKTSGGVQLMIRGNRFARPYIDVEGVDLDTDLISNDDDVTFRRSAEFARESIVRYGDIVEGRGLEVHECRVLGKQHLICRIRAMSRGVRYLHEKGPIQESYRLYGRDGAWGLPFWYPSDMLPSSDGEG